MKRLCVYCGSKPGKDPAFRETATAFGRALAERDIELVYGGGNVGMMGTVADAVLEAGGDAHGVIPESLVEREPPHQGLTELEIVESMHERKARMVDLADGFVALPGGYGTFEELLEVLTWAQLGFHRNPCGILNASDYYTDLVAFLDHAVEEEFVSPDHREMVVVAEEPDVLLDEFAAYEAPEVKRYVSEREET